MINLLYCIFIVKMYMCIIKVYMLEHKSIEYMYFFQENKFKILYSKYCIL